MRQLSAACSLASCVLAALATLVLQGCAGSAGENAQFLVLTTAAGNGDGDGDGDGDGKGSTLHSRDNGGGHGEDEHRGTFRRLAPAQVCSAKGENCQSTGCCSNAELHCFEKDASFASCRANCTPGFYDADPEGYRQPWTCRLLEPQQPSGQCVAEHQRCSAGACCDGLSCYEKDATWSGCKRACTPGIDPTDPPGLQTPWSCRRMDVTTEEERDSEVEVLDDQDVSTEPSPAWLSSHCRDDADGKGTEGPLQMQGLNGTTYAQGGGGEVSGDALTLHHNSGYSIMSTCRAAWAPDEFVQFRLLGRSISFEVDLSKVGCACNLAFYLVGGPALDEAGVPSKGECDESPYYCDANRVCGQWCPEIDIMEANNHVFAATPHKCDAPSDAGHFSSCDRSGCAQNTRDMPGMYGPGPGFTINTLLPFEVRTSFEEQSGSLSGMTTTLQQGDRSAVLNHGNCDPSYLAQLSAALSAGMSLRITYWGDSAETMGWLDHPTCGQEACTGGNAGPGVIGRIAVDPPQEGTPTRPVPGWKALPPPLPATEPTTSLPAAVPPPNTTTTQEELFEPLPVEESVHVASLWAQGLLGLGLGLLGAYALAVVVLWCIPSWGPALPLQSEGLRRSGSACALRPNLSTGSLRPNLSTGSLRPSGSEGDLARAGLSSRELRPSGIEADAGVSSHQLSASKGAQESGPCKGLSRAVQAVNEVLRSRLCCCCPRRGLREQPGAGLP